MLNYIWLALILISVVVGGFNGTLKGVSDGALENARIAVMGIALPFVGAWAIWLGVMRLAERSGLVELLARALRPLLRILFPDVPGNHPAMGAMVMNIAANMLGLGNAATPLGLRAMTLLEKLNPHPGTATNAMCTFLAINTSSVQLLPTTALAIFVAQGAKDPTAIVGTSLLATSCACVAGVTTAKLLEKLPVFAQPRAQPIQATANVKPGQEPEGTPEPPLAQAPTPSMIKAGPAILVFFGLVCAALLYREMAHPSLSGDDPMALIIARQPFLRVVRAVSLLVLPLMLAFLPLYAAVRRIKVYEEFVEGAKESFQVALRVIPFLVAMLMAIGMFRGSGAMDMLTNGLRPVLARVGFPADLLPLVLMRPLSGSGTTGLFADLVTRFGPDSLIARTAGTIYGSTETTFYVIAVYFGSVAVRRTRHAIAAGLVADATGVVVSIIICRLLFR